MVDKQSSPLIEMVNKQFLNLWNCSGVVLKKAVFTAYGNGYASTSSIYINGASRDKS
jgi:hypothetical protein